jgi:catechol 2,3-dioxygenase-like lactoylglutathione lyase family enzyme
MTHPARLPTSPAESRFARLGPIMQLAFVPADFDAAITHWTEVMGAGPFFLLENIALPNMRVMGQPSDAVFSLALGYWGDLQIELIRPENDAPSIYRGAYAADGALHHVCILVDDIAAAKAVCAATGANILVEADVAGGGAVIYADPGGGPGSVIEMLQASPGTDGVFAMMHDAAKNWDGRDPLRRLG